MKTISIVSVIIIILISSCSSDDNRSVDLIQEAEVSNIFTEKSKRGNERFVIMGEYSYLSYLAHKDASMRMYSKAIFDVDTDVVQLRRQNEYGSRDTIQFRIEKLVKSDDICESYKIITLKNDQPATLILIESGLILGPYPAEIPHESWQMHYDLSKAEQVYDDLNYYLDEIEDISF